ncbi:hypothetical protein HMPREF0381_1035 [Lachnoanaerobaculum saburreum DSM 3986]|uniref:Uncharacterized protein n=1 Tax=Lachnoanaerobaculum saburreum DSM 3986 TaxID=887325 RepID=E6LM50_9FIRM|nr:hypothetical protein HMPREF0381_1035 [Lachnoanaerobaculum saburreum DSM 3986]
MLKSRRLVPPVKAFDEMLYFLYNTLRLYMTVILRGWHKLPFSLCFMKRRDIY